MKFYEILLEKPHRINDQIGKYTKHSKICSYFNVNNNRYRTSNAIMIVLTVISKADLKHLNLKITFWNYLQFYWKRNSIRIKSILAYTH